MTRSASSSAADFDAKPACQTRPYAFVETFEIARRPVGRDHDLPAGIDQGIERMAELLLNRLALQKLNVVDHENIDRPQPLLEGNCRLRLEGGDEAIHEPFGGEIDDLAACADEAACATAWRRWVLPKPTEAWR